MDAQRVAGAAVKHDRFGRKTLIENGDDGIGIGGWIRGRGIRVRDGRDRTPIARIGRTFAFDRDGQIAAVV
jgi:hypothetical protein